MKNKSQPSTALFMLCVFCLFLGKGITFAQSCNCDYTISLTTKDVDNNSLHLRAGSVICIQGGVRDYLNISNFNTDSAFARFKFINCNGQVVIQSNYDAYGIRFTNCKNFQLTGTGTSGVDYGFYIQGKKRYADTSSHELTPEWGLITPGKSTDFEIDHVKITKIDFSGMGLKTDPDCNDASTWRNNFTMRNVSVHDNMVDSTQRGEGYYIGYSFYSGNPNSSCPTVLPHAIENLRVFHNTAKNTGADGIQVGCANYDCQIYGNHIENYGVSPFDGNTVQQGNGIQLGDGTTGLCYNNFIKAKPNAATGGGIKIFGIDNEVFNNVIIQPYELGMFVDERQGSDIGTGSGYRIYNNTIINPNGDGMRLFSEQVSNNWVKNNIIVKSSGSGSYINLGSGVPIDSSNNYRTNSISSIHFLNAAGDDYHLTSTSPCIGAGINLYAEGVKFDFDNIARPVSGNFEIGAFEFTAAYNIATGSFYPSTICNSTSNVISIPYSVNQPFNSGNTFTAQLSDASGGFGSPTTIGTLSATTGGTLYATIPSGTTAGTGYKIRITGSNPAVTGSVSASTLTINSVCTPSVTTGTITPVTFCNNQTTSVTVPYTVNMAFSSGNVFTAQLSDASGSFSTPSNIGTLTATGSGTISATVPSGLTAGSAYKIRVVASNPSVTGTTSASTLTVSSTCNTACSGTLLREYWANISGGTIWYLTNSSNYPNNPTSTSTLNSFEAPQNIGDNYGTRIRGYVCPPSTGYYTFYISADDAAELWLSTNDDPANVSKIAYLTGYSDFRQWTKYASQQSAQIYLVAGQKYYVEALHKEGAGGDHVSVGWDLPDATQERPIPASRISIYNTSGGTPPSTCSVDGTLIREFWGNLSGGSIWYLTSSPDYPNNPTSSGTVTSFEGPQNVADNYGSRIRGYLCPPVSGYYTFYVSADDAAELWLSTNSDPANKSKIAYLTAFSSYRQWTKYASQQSAPIYLMSGQKYYVEALHKEGAGGDHLSVGWDLPGGTQERPIPATRISSNSAGSPPPSCLASGTITREYFGGIAGGSIWYLTNSANYPNNPTSTGTVTALEGPQNVADNYGTRIRGFICVPQSGNYTFYVSGDDAAELWLSTSDDPAYKTRIAYLTAYSNFREWTKYATQQSAPISLSAGQSYYIEVLHKEGGGSDHVSVGWDLPDGTQERPIPSTRISPWSGGPSRIGLLDDTAPDDNAHVYPNPASDLLYVESGSKISGEVEILDGVGQVVKTISGYDDSEAIHVEDLSPGIYIITIKNADVILRRRVVIHH